MKLSITRSYKSRSALEHTMHSIFLICGWIAVLAVLLISLYMVISGGPAIAKIGVAKFLFGQIWNPEGGQFGILPMILSSLCATGLAVLVAVPVGIGAAVFMTFIAGKRSGGIFLFLVELMASIPSVVYGLLGAILIVPVLFQLQEALSLPQSGSLAAAAVVLVIMILPTIISVSVSSLKAVPKQYYDAALSLGASKIQGIFQVVLPAAKSGITAGVVLGIGRAVGETMAVLMVAGNAPIMPQLLEPVRLLTVGISLEWAYSSGQHREALLGIGLVLFVFIMITNIVLSTMLKRGGAKR